MLPLLSRVLPTRTRALQEMPHSRREVRYESRDLSHYGEGVKGVGAHETKTWSVSVSRVLILPSARHACPQASAPHRTSHAARGDNGWAARAMRHAVTDWDPARACQGMRVGGELKVSGTFGIL